MGQERTTLKNKKIVAINDSLLLISGPIPGAKGDLIAVFKE